VCVNYNNQGASRRRQKKLSDLLELQAAHKRRERRWRDHLGRQRKVEHALLDINSILPSNTGDAEDEQKTSLVWIGVYCVYSLVL